MFKIFVNEIELKNFPITCDEYSGAHNGLKYNNGVLQLPLDHGGMKVGWNVTFDVGCTLYSRGSGGGNWICVRPDGYPQFLIMFVHVDSHFSTVVGTHIAAGVSICKIASSANNGGFAIHLHDAARKDGKSFKIRDIIYAQPDLPINFKIGDVVQFTGIQRVRKGSGLSYEIIRQSEIGSTFKIVDGPRVADGSVWYDTGNGWVADVQQFVIYVLPVQPPVTNPDTPTQNEPEAPTAPTTNDNSSEVPTDLPQTPEIPVDTEEPQADIPDVVQTPKKSLFEIFIENLIKYITDFFQSIKKSG